MASERRRMDGNFNIGRYGGVEVRLNWSLVVVFALIVWSLAEGVFPSQNPGLSDGAYVAMGVVAALLFLASILLHELGHSWVARHEGIEVDSIILWLFGGVSQFKGRFTSAGAEFRVALSGPLVSIGLGVLFVLIALADVPSSVDGVAAWLGYINLILAAFNLLPASPLDGGRVLHAALWRAKGDYAWATRVASEIGQGFGYLFIGLGLAMFIFQGSFSGAWLAFIGWFLLQGARGEARYVATEQALAGLRVRDLMVRDPVTVDADSTIERFMDDVARSHRFTTYPVLEGGRPVGLLAFGSVAAVPRPEWNTRRARDTMIPLDEVPLLTEDEDAVEALAELSAPDANRGLVVDDGHLAGLLSITDLARALEVGRRPAKALPERG
jgi:Zn-dependent protease